MKKMLIIIKINYELYCQIFFYFMSKLSNLLIVEQSKQIVNIHDIMYHNVLPSEMYR